MYFNSQIQVTYRGAQIYPLLTAALITKYIQDNGKECKLNVNGNLLYNLRLTYDKFLFSNPGDKPKVDIELLDDVENNNFKLLADSSDDLFKDPPWKTIPQKANNLMVLSAVSEQHNLSIDIWKKFGFESDLIELGTPFGTWKVLQENLPGIVVTDNVTIVRLAGLLRCEIVYVGGVNPHGDWWPVFPKQHGFLKVHWIPIKDISYGKSKIIKRCNCKATSECHARSQGETTLPCIESLKNSQVVSHINSQLRSIINKIRDTRKR